LGSSNTVAGANTIIKLKLDGTELYGEDGQTVADITELDSKEVLQILEVKKRGLIKSPKIKTRNFSLIRIGGKVK